MWLDIQIFGNVGLWSPYFASFIILIGVGYFFITGSFSRKFSSYERATLQQQIYFCISLILLYISKGSPIDLLSHIMLSMHMAQLALLFLVFPIFFILGIPEWIWRKIINIPLIKPVFNLFSNPIIAIVVFNLLFSIIHMPSVFNFSKTSQVAHSSITMVVLLAAILMWWNVVTPIKERDKIIPLLKIVYIFANAALITPACVLIIFASEPLFAAYSSSGAWMQAMSLCVPGDILQGIGSGLTGAERFSPLSTIDDQQLGGIIMQTLSTIIYGTMIGRIFFSWFKKESHTIDPLPATPM